MESGKYMALDFGCNLGLTCLGVTSSCSLQACTYCLLNGIGLALVSPSASSVLADLYNNENRGKAFGSIMTFAALGEAQPVA